MHALDGVPEDQKRFMENNAAFSQAQAVATEQLAL